MASQRFFLTHRSFSCPIKSAAHLLGDKWILFILREFMEKEAFGFNKLHSSLEPISSRTLTLKLDMLEKANLLERKVIRFKPKKVEYTLNEKGRSLLPLIRQMGDWFKENYGEVKEGI